mmetsp:Transcript_24174/g.37170  ORF Transcript_24174/g.37170 Transcript_24174/m.37170 type:complete len:143 (+) Transcript_24174:5237-5665(+)
MPLPPPSRAAQGNGGVGHSGGSVSTVLMCSATGLNSIAEGTSNSQPDAHHSSNDERRSLPQRSADLAPRAENQGLPSSSSTQFPGPRVTRFGLEMKSLQEFRTSSLSNERPRQQSPEKPDAPEERGTASHLFNNQPTSQSRP